MKLLVSVRSAEEAEAALRGGAGLIDVKEPARGPLGAADADVIRAVIAQVNGRLPVSAALGELPAEDTPPPVSPELHFVKWGLAGWRRHAWQPRLDLMQKAAPGKLVVTAYADEQHAQSPPVGDLADWACEHRAAAFLVDTFAKVAGRSLLTWLRVSRLVRLCEQCRLAGVPVALAGSLGESEIGRLLVARPDWFAVRGAACGRGDRRQDIEEARVRALVRLIGSLPQLKA